MGRKLDFVAQRDCKILKGNRAFSVGSCQKLVGPEPELAGPLARHKQRRRRDEGPVQVFLLGESVEKGGALLGLRLVLQGKTRRRDQPDAGGHFEAAGAADHEVAPDTRILGGPDQFFRIAGEEMDRGDRGIMAGQQLRQGGAIVGVALFRRDMGQACDLFRLARDGGNGVAAAGQFLYDGRGGLSRRAIATVPVTVEYSITPLGATLAAAVDPLRDWAESNLKEVLTAQRRYDAQHKAIAA